MQIRYFLVLVTSCLIGLSAAFAQRKLPYPIVLVHGFAGKSDNWKPFADYLTSQIGLYASPNSQLDYCLNSDSNQSRAQVYATTNWRSDIYDYNLTLQASDIYRVNFDACANSGGSNRSAAVKQGYAVGLAVARVLAVTGADKVILMGHSMGGLAIREYLQTRSNWAVGDGQHHVAKVVTVGTPHGGSNLGTGDINLGDILGFVANDYDEMSEAVRDLRTSYKTGYDGVYLFGGRENSTHIKRGFFSTYHNLDVNCNGQEGDLIQGLNQKNIPSDLAYSLVVGNLWGSSGDGIVTLWSQNLNNFYGLNAPVFYHSFSHTGAIEKAVLEEVNALDEPAALSQAYNVNLNQTYLGVFSKQANGGWQDIDRYRFYTPGRGILTVSVNSLAAANPIGRLLDWNGNTVGSRSGVGTYQLFTNGGSQYMEWEGTSGSGWYNYTFSLSHCPLPNDPSISNLGKPTLCEGESTTLTTPAGYSGGYVWYRNGVRLPETGNQLVVNTTGNYTVDGIGCGVTRAGVAVAGITVNPKPATPTISLSPDGQGLRSSESTGNQWFVNGQPLAGATGPLLSYSLVGAGSVGLQVTSAQGCVNQATPFVILANKPVQTELMVASPNPAITDLHINLTTPTAGTLQMTNIVGQTVWSHAAAAGSERVQVDVSNWPRGLYLLRFASQSSSQTVKVLIQ
jgi:pimeloyl-ACP methyl ester carboxylesterase